MAKQIFNISDSFTHYNGYVWQIKEIKGNKDGDRSNPVKNTDLPVDLWQKYASPVWMDIDYGNTLQGFRNGREENDEKHICPLYS